MTSISRSRVLSRREGDGLNGRGSGIKSLVHSGSAWHPFLIQVKTLGPLERARRCRDMLIFAFSPDKRHEGTRDLLLEQRQVVIRDYYSCSGRAAPPDRQQASLTQLLHYCNLLRITSMKVHLKGCLSSEFEQTNATVCIILDRAKH